MLFINDSNNALLEKIKTDEDEIILNGSPSLISGFLQVNNTLKETVKIKSISLSEKPNSKEKSNLRISWKLQPGETKLQPVNFTMPPETPPGEYTRYMNIGGKKQKVKIVVQPTIEIDVSPAHFTLQNTVPGTKQSIVFTLSNLGNLDFQIPEIKHIAALDMDYLCRAFGFAFRDLKAEGFEKTLDTVTQNIKDNLADWANVKVREAGKILEPGKSILVHLDFTLPKNADPKNDYSGNIRFWDKDLSFVIKAHNDSKNTQK